MVRIDKRSANIQAGELKIPKGEIVLPSKLNLLATAGWGITDVYKNKNGDFNLLLVRDIEVEYETD